MAGSVGSASVSGKERGTAEPASRAGHEPGLSGARRKGVPEGPGKTPRDGWKPVRCGLFSRGQPGALPKKAAAGGGDRERSNRFALPL